MINKYRDMLMHRMHRMHRMHQHQQSIEIMDSMY